MLPITTAENSKLFGEAVEAPGYKTCPQHGTLTTLKMRTQFQGQPEKDGDLTAVRNILNWRALHNRYLVEATTLLMHTAPSAMVLSSRL